MNGVYDNDDFGNFMWDDGLVDITSDSEELGFKACNIDSVVKSFDKWFVMYMDMHYRYSNIVLDASICYYEYVSWSVGEFNS